MVYSLYKTWGNASSLIRWEHVKHALTQMITPKQLLKDMFANPLRAVASLSLLSFIILQVIQGPFSPVPYIPQFLSFFISKDLLNMLARAVYEGCRVFVARTQFFMALESAGSLIWCAVYFMGAMFIIGLVHPFPSAREQEKAWRPLFGFGLVATCGLSLLGAWVFKNDVDGFLIGYPAFIALLPAFYAAFSTVWHVRVQRGSASLFTFFTPFSLHSIFSFIIRFFPLLFFLVIFWGIIHLLICGGLVGVMLLFGKSICWSIFIRGVFVLSLLYYAVIAAEVSFCAYFFEKVKREIE